MGIFCLLLPILLTCEKNPVSFSLKAITEFATEPRPHTILFDEKSGYLYVANSNPSYRNDSRKIQCFDRQGNYIKTIVDFAADTNGAYDYYQPIDMTLDSDHHLAILVKPYRKYIDDSWFPYEGFCIMKYGSDGSFLSEFDFAQFESEWHPAAIAFYDGFLYVINDRVLLKINKNDGQAVEISLASDLDLYLLPPTDMGIDSRGAIWMVGQAGFADTTVGCQLTRINLMENSVRKFYSKGRTKDYGAMLNNPGIAIDQDDHLFLATFYCQSLEVFDRDGQFLNEIELDHERKCLPIDVGVDNRGNVFVVDNLNGVVRMLKKQ